MGTSRALNQYKKDVLQSNVANADPHRLIQMLLEGALSNIAMAKNFLQNQQVAEKGEKISRAISILECLRASLNHEAGGEISTNLESLYEYMQNKLLEANLSNDLAAFDEVSVLLGEVKSAWDDISPAQADASTGDTTSSSIGKAGQA
jgi:flagellar protein FliS